MEHLLPAVASGDPSAVDACLRKYTGAVWSLARRLSPDVHEAEDAVQEVFVDLWKSAGRFDPEAGSEMTFVMTIARRRLVDRRRRGARARETQSLAEPESLPSEERTDMAELSDEAARVRRAFEELRPEQRRVLQLSLVGGHSHQQVAERTGLPLGTVKSHARRGLMRVRQMLGVDPSPSAEVRRDRHP